MSNLLLLDLCQKLSLDIMRTVITTHNHVTQQCYIMYYKYVPPFFLHYNSKKKRKLLYTYNYCTTYGSTYYLVAGTYVPYLETCGGRGGAEKCDSTVTCTIE